MQHYPFITSVYHRIVGITAALVIWAILCCLLCLYSNIGWMTAFCDSFIYVALLAGCSLILWFATNFIRSLYIQAALAFIVQLICITGSLIVWLLFGRDIHIDFLHTLPLRIVFGIAVWIILQQWYQQFYREEEEEEPEVDRSSVSAQKEEQDVLDRITVKDGSRIHLIHVEELLYIQACGDYVTLVTDEGQFVEDQTMKYLETHLPEDMFVRIHRSCIVNVEQIMRVELFGKENYKVKLKNGTCLKVSLSGYKALKSRLSL
jgi:hypothetical protein